MTLSRTVVLSGVSGLIWMCMYLHTVATQSATGSVEQLQYISNSWANPFYRYQARCSIPCSGSYSRGDLYVTIVVDKMTRNFYSFGKFKANQTSPSIVWEIVNTNYIQETSGYCTFDIQLDHTGETPVPGGSCQMGWDAAITCPSQTDQDTCTNLGSRNLNECYNQTTFSQCCNVCSQLQMNIEDCPYGDRQPSQCTALQDEECYNPYLEEQCCAKCHNIEQSHPSIPGCPYGDRDRDSCYNMTISECYTQEYKCCESCYWMKEDIPGCKYGNRRPSFCDYILTSDCYNVTIRGDCCETCNGIKNEDEPTCLYGDRNSTCYSKQRSECYNNTVRFQCCGTCAEQWSDIQGCEYGDKDNCSSYTRTDCDNPSIKSRCCQTCDFLISNSCQEEDATSCQIWYGYECYDPEVRSRCCKACLQFYQPLQSDENCSFGNRGSCWYLTAESCYDTETEKDCCEICSYYAYSDAPDDCKYGDHTPTQCYDIKSHDCYDPQKARDCCSECSYKVAHHLPQSCKYGDKAENCSSVVPYQCYDKDTEQKCCEKCANYNATDEYGAACKYGDRRDNCYTEQPYICYNAEDKRDCCRYCQNYKDTSAAGCEYGDKDAICSNNLTPRDCYDLEQTCCQSCPRLLTYLNITNCKYGDRADSCPGIQVSACYNADTARDCCQTCFILQNIGSADCTFGDRYSNCTSIQRPWECYSREADCCQTCEAKQINITGLGNCKYGDRSDRCLDIETYECYTTSFRTECCKTCHERKRSDLPVSCEYGDKVDSCYNIYSNGAECYNAARRNQCCDTCNDIQTNDWECRYGDRHLDCQAIQAATKYRCYDNEIEADCCVACPLHKDETMPECEYGDTYGFCSVTDCGTYTTGRMQDCCYTCRNYKPTTRHSVSTTDQEETTPVTPEVTTQGNTGKPDSQTGSSSTLPIVGGAVGGVVVLVLIIVVACFILKTRRKSEKSSSGMSRPVALESTQLRNGASHLNNPADRNGTQPQQQPLNRQESKPEEEVYDYINPDDVKTVVSMPPYRGPSIPDRNQQVPYNGYVDPIKKAASKYENPAYQKDNHAAEPDYHMYHTLSKEEDVGREYMHL